MSGLRFLHSCQSVWFELKCFTLTFGKGWCWVWKQDLSFANARVVIWLLLGNIMVIMSNSKVKVRQLKHWGRLCKCKQMLLLDFDRTWLPGLCIQIECATCPFTNSSLTSTFTFSLCLLSDCALKTPIWTKLLEILSWHHSASQHLHAHYRSPYHFF